jgi:hypothetical protein
MLSLEFPVWHISSPASPKRSGAGQILSSFSIYQINTSHTQLKIFPRLALAWRSGSNCTQTCNPC